MAGIYQLRINYLDGTGNPSQNVLHYSLDELGGASPYDFADELITAFRAANDVTLLACLATDVSIKVIDAKRIYPVGSVSAFQLVDNAGTGPFQSVTNSSGAIIALYPEDTYNRAGHMFLPAAWDGAIVQSALQGAYVGFVAAFAANLVTPLTLGLALGTATPGIYQRKTHTLHTCSEAHVLPHVGELSKRLRPYS